ncbi:MAG TPA: cbb3-type cytochrome c oxidase subunit 3 [Longimicrobiales bacterium]
MNPVLHDAARYVELGWLMGIMTVVFLSAFIGAIWWALAKSNRARFEEAARMPLANGDDYE